VKGFSKSQQLTWNRSVGDASTSWASNSANFFLNFSDAFE